MIAAEVAPVRNWVVSLVRATCGESEHEIRGESDVSLVVTLPLRITILFEGVLGPMYSQFDGQLPSW